MEYKFNYDEKEYILSDDNLEYFANDEENPIEDINEEEILEIMAKSDMVDFSKAYFDLPCSICKEGVAEKKKFFDFLGYNFYIYTKDNKYVISTIEKQYEGSSYNRLERAGKVDNSYIVTVNVCRHCGSYSIEVEQLEV